MRKAGFKDFMAQGGVLGLIKRHRLVPLREIRSHFDSIRILAVGALISVPKEKLSR
jgi:hypothetical protein